VLVVEERVEGIQCSQLKGAQTILLSGQFAASLSALLNGPIDERQKMLLDQLSRPHPWLHGLSSATTSPKPVSSLLLGDSLGMLFIELTSRCNERCLHCYAESGPDRNDILSFEEVRNILRQARQLGHPTLQFTGGDPLIHPDLVALVKEARQLEYEDVEIYTNGLLLNDALLKKLLPYAPRFAFSLYSHDPGTHDRITRTPGSFGRTFSAIERVKKAGIEARIGVTIMAENQGHEQGIVDFVKAEMGIEPGQINFDTVKTVGRGNDSGISLTSINRHDPGHVTRKKKDAREAHAARQQGKLAIAANGDVYPCIFARRTLLGNIRKYPLPEIMQTLDRRSLPEASSTRWKRCRQSLSCRDCQVVSYILGMEDAHATA